MSIYRRVDELFVRRMAERSWHDPTCHYYREHQDKRGPEVLSLEATRLGTRIRPTKPPTFYELDAEAGNPDNPPLAQYDTDRKHPAARVLSISSLAAKMFWLLDAAGANVFGQDDNIMRRLIGTVRSVPVGVNTLADFMYFSPKAVIQSLVVIAAQRARHLGLPAYAYLMCSVTQIDLDKGRSVIAYKGEEVAITHAGKFTLYGNENTPMPKLGLYQINDEGFAISGYFHPIYSERYWCPVDSNEERLFLRKLIKASIDLSNRARTRVTKPIYALDDTGYLADFLIDAHTPDPPRDVRVVIEVLGLQSEDYLAKKAKQSNVLSQQYPYVEYDARLPEAKRINIYDEVKRAIGL